MKIVDFVIPLLIGFVGASIVIVLFSLMEQRRDYLLEIEQRLDALEAAQ